MVTYFKFELNSTRKILIFLWVVYAAFWSAQLLESGVLTPKELPQPGPKSLVGHPTNKLVTCL